MNTAKVLETIFRRWWALVLPTLLVPILVFALVRPASTYSSQARIWIADPIVDQALSAGHSSDYLTPAQNQAQLLNDLLATDAFRLGIMQRAAIGPGPSQQEAAIEFARSLRISTQVIGANVIEITAQGSDAAATQRLASAVIDEYRVRANDEIARLAKSAQAYYTEQLPIAQRVLDQRKSALAAYVAAHPRAADATAAGGTSADPDYTLLLDQVNTQTKLVDQLQSSLEAVDLRLASAPESQDAAFRVEDAPQRAVSAEKASRSRTIGLPAVGAVLGLLAGAAYVYATYRSDRAVRSASDLAALHVNVLGSVPHLHYGPAWIRLTPLGWYWSKRTRPFARATAASIAPALAKDHPAEKGI